MKYLHLLMILQFVSCSSIPIPEKLNKYGDRMVADEPRRNTITDSTFSKFQKHFIKLKSAVDKEYRPSDVVIVFGPEFNEDYLSTTTAACIFYNNNKREIRINENKWNDLGSSQKEFAIYHYLVHCDLDLHYHNSRRTHQDIPVSTMSKYIVREEILKQNRAHYIKDLFKNY